MVINYSGHPIPGVLSDSIITEDKIDHRKTRRTHHRCDACYTGHLDACNGELARYSPEITLCSHCVNKAVVSIWGGDRGRANYNQLFRMYKKAVKMTPEHIRIANLVQHGPMPEEEDERN